MTNNKKNKVLNERISNVQYMMEHFDELPEKLQAKFEGIALAVNDLYLCELEKQPT